VDHFLFSSVISPGFNFIVEDLRIIAIFSNYKDFLQLFFFRQTSFKSVAEGFFAFHNFDNMVPIMGLINCHVMGFPPDVFNKTSKTLIGHYRRLLPPLMVLGTIEDNR